MAWNSTISTRGARYIVGDAGHFYLATPTERHEYLRIEVGLIPQEFMDLYDLHNMVRMSTYTIKLYEACMVCLRQVC